MVERSVDGSALMRCCRSEERCMERFLFEAVYYTYGDALQQEIGNAEVVPFSCQRRFRGHLTCKSLCETGNGGLVECEDTEQIGKVGEGVIDLESRGIVLNAVMNVHTQQ